MRITDLFHIGHTCTKHVHTMHLLRCCAVGISPPKVGGGQRDKHSETDTLTYKAAEKCTNMLPFSISFTYTHTHVPTQALIKSG